jgi:excisionase family DNA binding protein
MQSSTTKPEPLAVDGREAARLLSVSERTIFMLRKSGKIRAIKIGKGMQSRVLYPVESLRNFLAIAS